MGFPLVVVIVMFRPILLKELLTAMSKIGHDSWKIKLLKNSRMRILMEKKLVNKNGQILIANVKENI